MDNREPPWFRCGKAMRWCLPFITAQCVERAERIASIYDTV